MPTPEAPVQPPAPATNPPPQPPVPASTTSKPQVYQTTVPILITSSVAKPVPRTSKPPVRITETEPPMATSPQAAWITQTTTKGPFNSPGKLMYCYSPS